MRTAIETANAEQLAASDPKTSAFVAASAGSGKTKLLTDRLLRLMLSGTPPQKILCLTYTKAAAAEMAIRLNRRLGQWVAMPDETLNGELYALGVPRTARDTARKLFADVLDLPGGMRIFTIHAFCQSVLRRFPLEASLSPHFTLEDETEAAARLRESREAILAKPAHRAAIFALAAEMNETEFAKIIGRLAAGEDCADTLFTTNTQAALEAMQIAALAAGEHDHDVLVRRAVAWAREHDVDRVWKRIAEAGTKDGQKLAQKNLEWLAHDAERRVMHWMQWVAGHFTTTGEERKLPRLTGKAMAAEDHIHHPEIAAEQARIKAVEESRRAARLAALNKSLLAIARPILARDAAEKTGLAAVSYADLITRTIALLRNPDDVAWILYKLDGGIEHLLLDEVQDTAPAQWDITNAIATEFFAGAGARDTTRTIFAVGDPKQSIFSFQGADLQSFETNRAAFRARVKNAEQNWLDGNLSVSFRSTAPILKLVDAVFRDGFACEGVTLPHSLHHVVSREGQAGAITLLPLTTADPPSPVPAWSVPDAYETAISAKTALARSIAAYIRDALDDGKILPSRNAPATPGDFLILVRHRDEFLPALTRAAKDFAIPIAGADRMVLTEQQAVSDLLALCDSLLLPEDDLAFAQYLASPLGGLTDESLADLAIGRKTSLAATLFARRAEQPDWQAASDFFQSLLGDADYISPHALLAKILHQLGGRAKLLRRLGPDAAEPIDEFLAEALAFAARAPASLQQFVFELRQSGASIKREAEAAGNVVRIMTVHGAKGLQAPIVILPDTTSLPQQNENFFWLDVPQQPDQRIPIYCPRAELRSKNIADAATAHKAAGQREYNRLLYVALTRAEDEILIAGAEGAKKIPDTCWYRAIEAGFDRLGIAEGRHGIRSMTTPQTENPDREAARTTVSAVTLPGWAGAAPDWRATPPAAETTRPEPLAPSRSADDPAKAAKTASPLAGDAAPLRDARAAAMAKGRAVHALLQHLPDMAEPARRDAALKYLRTPALALKNPEAIAGSVLAILENPALAPLFAAKTSRAEIPLAGVVNGAEIGGLVDRLAITPEKILIADYKTNRAPPATADEIPIAYLRQLAAYAAILGEIFPGRPVECLLIWTETALPMPIPAEMIDRHAPAPAQP